MSEPPQKRSRQETDKIEDTSSDDKSSEIVALYLDLLNAQKKERQDYIKKAGKMYDKILKTENKIMKLCKHNWITDYSYCEPRGRLARICTKCGLNW